MIITRATQPDRLELVEPESYLFEHPHGYSGRLEIDDRGIVSYGARFRWSWH